MKLRTLLYTTLLAVLTLVSCSSSRITNQVRKSIVRIESTVPTEGTSVCSGFLVDKNTILTANHCVGQLMTADGQEFTLIRADRYFDLAVGTAMSNRKPLTIRPSEVRAGDLLVGTGYAWGWSILTSMDQIVIHPSYAPISTIPRGIITKGGYIGGMSGGPITDSDGNVVGVVQQTREGFGYGVGTTIIRAFLLDAGVEIN